MTTIRNLFASLLVVFTLVPAFAQASGYKPGQDPAQHPVTDLVSNPDCLGAVMVPAGTAISTDSGSHYNVKRPVGYLAAQHPAFFDICLAEQTGVISRVLLGGCLNDTDLTPGIPYSPEVLQPLDFDPSVYFRTELDTMDDAMWLDAHMTAYCQEVRFDRYGSGPFGFTAIVSEVPTGYIGRDPSKEDTAISYTTTVTATGGTTATTGVRYSGDELKGIAEKLQFRQICPGTPHQIWYGDITTNEAGNVIPLCVDPVPADKEGESAEKVKRNAMERTALMISAQRSTADQSFEEFVREIVRTGLGRIEGDYVVLNNRCEKAQTLAETYAKGQAAFDASYNGVGGYAGFQAGVGHRFGGIACDTCEGAFAFQAIVRGGLRVGNGTAAFTVGPRFGTDYMANDPLAMGLSIGGDIGGRFLVSRPVGFGLRAVYDARMSRGLDSFLVSNHAFGGEFEVLFKGRAHKALPAGGIWAGVYGDAFNSLHGDAMAIHQGAKVQVGATFLWDSFASRKKD